MFDLEGSGLGDVNGESIEQLESPYISSDPEICFELGRLSTERGPLLTLAHHSPYDSDNYVLELGDRTTRFSLLQSLRAASNKLSMGPEANFAKILGFNRASNLHPEMNSLDLTTVPTSVYVNNTLRELYSEFDVEPPFQFIDADEGETLTDSDRLHSLAEGKVIIPDLNDEILFTNDMMRHVLGFTRLNSSTSEAIKLQARRLVNEGLDETRKDVYSQQNSGELVYSEAIIFMRSVGRLTTMMTRYPELFSAEVKDIKNIIPFFTIGIGPKMIRILARSNTEIHRRLIDHQPWLEQRAIDLQSGS